MGARAFCTFWRRVHLRRIMQQAQDGVTGIDLIVKPALFKPEIKRERPQELYAKPV